MAEDIRVPFESLADPFGVEAVVTPPGGSEIETTAIWIDASILDAPALQEFQRVEGRRVLALSRDDCPSVPTGTIVVAPLRKDDTARRWRVDSPVAIDADLVKVLVVPATDEDT
jgi:hypothetical protein